MLKYTGSRISGEFDGWNGESLYELDNQLVRAISPTSARWISFTSCSTCRT